MLLINSFLKSLTHQVRFAPSLLYIISLMLGNSLWFSTPVYAAATNFPTAKVHPVIEGQFTSSKEYKKAKRIRDDLDVGDFFMESMGNWEVNETAYAGTVTLFITHFFDDPSYGQLDNYDLNSLEYYYGNTKVKVWVFLPGDEVDDPRWMSVVGLGDHIPHPLNDDGGFLVRLNDDPTTDRIWLPGDPEPGDLDWDFADYYGVFAKGGFNNSAGTTGMSPVTDAREIYEFSITLNMDEALGGIPGVPFDWSDNPPVIQMMCGPFMVSGMQWEKVNGWKPEMGGFGKLGGIGDIEDMWVEMIEIQGPHPLLVVLADDFEATLKKEGDGIILNWSTLFELDNAGFNVWRFQIEESEEKTEPVGITKLNDKLISAQGNLTTYSQEDPDLTPGINYYVLQDFATDGSDKVHCDSITAIILGEGSQQMDLSTAVTLCKKYTGVRAVNSRKMRGNSC